MPIQTLVIASTVQEAALIIRATPAENGVKICSANHAYSALTGGGWDRIVIAGDYLRWNLTPGRLTNLWRMVTTCQYRDDARVMFL